MIDRDPFYEKFVSQKERHDLSMFSLYLQYDMDRRKKDFNAEITKVCVMATAASDGVVLEGTLSRKGNVLAVFIPYARIPELIINNPDITQFEVLDQTLIPLLQTDSEEVTVKAPWPGPEGDEWDSPSYDDFWHGAEQNLNRKIETLERVGKRVKVV